MDMTMAEMKETAHRACQRSCIEQVRDPASSMSEILSVVPGTATLAGAFRAPQKRVYEHHPHGGNALLPASLTVY